MHKSLKRLATGGATACLAIGLMATTAGAAPRHTGIPRSTSTMAATAPAAQMGDYACSGGGGTVLVICLWPWTTALSTSPPNCTPFSNGLEWQSFTDANGARQLWTYSNGSNACVQVNYYPVLAPGYDCDYFFYVPNGYANAHLYFGWWDTSGQKHYAKVVDESGTSGWYQLQMNDPIGDGAGARNVTRISFQDNNGQAPGSTYIGWGDSLAYGIEQFC